MSKTAEIESICTTTTLIAPRFHTQKPLLPTPHRTHDAESRCSRLGMDVPEGHNQTRGDSSPVPRRGDVDDSEIESLHHHPSSS